MMMPSPPLRTPGHCWPWSLSAAGSAGTATAADPVTIWAGQPSQHTVALTFDDGPSPTYTREILALLRQYQAKATFFVLGEKVEKYPELIRAMVRNGHEVGNHTFDHCRLTKTAQPARERELERTQLDLDLLGCPGKRRADPAALQRLSITGWSPTASIPAGKLCCGVSTPGIGGVSAPRPSSITSWTG